MMKMSISFACNLLLSLTVLFGCVVDLMASHTANWKTISVQDDYEVGEQVKFSFLGDEVVGTIIEVMRTGWYRVEFNGHFGKQKTILSPQQVLGRVESTGDVADENAAKMSGTNEEHGTEAFRVWTDRNGNTIEARFVELKDNQVKLEKKDGETLTVKLVDLSVGDFRVAGRLAAGIPLGNDRLARNRPETPSETVDYGGHNIVEFDFDSVEPIDVTVSGWDLKREPVIPDADWDHNQSFSMQLQATHSAGVLFDPRVPSRGFVRATRIGKSPTGFLFDCTSGRTIGPFTITTPKAVILGYDAVGHRLVTSTSWSRRNRTVDIWKIGPDDVEHQFSFSPYPIGTKIQLPLTSALFIDQDRIAVTYANRLAVYDLTRKKAKYRIEFDLMSRPKLGSDIKYAYGLIDNHVVAIDLDAGKAVAKSPLTLETTSGRNRQPTQLFSVSPDLTRLVTMKRRYLELFDLASGEQIESFFLPTVIAQQPMFLDGENVLVISNMGGSLVNIPLKSAIWNYSFCDFTFGPLGAKEIWTSTDATTGSAQGWQGRFSATATPIPNQNARTVIDSLDLNDLIVLQPGDSVSLDLSAAKDGRSVIVDQLQSLGINIDRNSTNQLKATVTQGASETTSFRDATSASGSQSVTYSSTHFELALIQNGEKVWYIRGGSSSKDLGDFVVLYDDETLQGRADEGRIGPGQFFSAIRLPEKFIKVPEKGFYGFSKGSINGFEEE